MKLALGGICSCRLSRRPSSLPSPMDCLPDAALAIFFLFSCLFRWSLPVFLDIDCFEWREPFRLWPTLTWLLCSFACSFLIRMFPGAL